VGLVTSVLIVPDVHFPESNDPHLQLNGTLAIVVPLRDKYDPSAFNLKSFAKTTAAVSSTVRRVPFWIRHPVVQSVEYVLPPIPIK
jgi:hypothetical protein